MEYVYCKIKIPKVASQKVLEKNNGMLYSVPFEYIKRKVNVRITDYAIEFFLIISALFHIADFLVGKDNIGL